MPDAPTALARLLLLGSMTFAIFLTVTTVASPGPLLVDMSVALGTTIPVTGQLITIAAGIWAVTAVVAGPFSDAYGRKPVLLLGTCLLAAGAIGIGLAPSFALAAAASVLPGMGGGMVPPTCIALTGDVFPEARRPMAIAILTTAPGVASVVGVPLAAVLGDFAGWRVPFLVLGVALVLAATVLWICIPSRGSQKVQLNLAARLHRVVTFPVTWYVAGTNFMARVTWGVIATFFPAYLILTYDLGTAEVALPVAIVAVGATAASFLGGRMGRARRRLPTTAGLLLAATVPGIGIFLFAWGTWLSVATAWLFMLLIVPVTTVVSILFAEAGGTSRGTLAGIISSTNWGGTAAGAAGAAIGGLLVAQVGYGALSFMLVVSILSSGLLMAFLVNDKAVVRAREHFSGTPKK